MSDRVAVTLWEPLSTLRDEGLEDLIRAHHAEVGLHKDRMPLAVDWEKYHEIERLGILKLASARAGEDLVGYASFLVMPHLHYCETPHALSDAVYVTPAWRGSGMALIRACERRLAADAAPGLCRIVYHIKTAVAAERGTFAVLMQRLGYSAFETCFDKLVGG